MKKYKEERIWNNVYKEYIGNNWCKKCRERCKMQNVQIGLPVGIWQYGENFESKENNKLMFIGKTAVTEKKDDIQDNIERYKQYASAADLLYNDNYSAYWHYVKEIVDKVCGNNGWENIAFSNLIKCNNNSVNDTTLNTMIECCCRENMIILREIVLIKPKYVIFMVGDYYFNHIKDMLENGRQKYLIKQYDIISCGKVSVGRKVMPYYKFNITYIDDSIAHCLLVGHPQYKNKYDYVEKVVSFIKDI